MSWTYPRPERTNLTIHPRPLRTLLRPVPVLLLALAACRADSLSAPSEPVCATGACPTPPTSDPVTPEARAALSDAHDRILSGISDRATSSRLTPALDALSAHLAAGRLQSARIQLASVYDLLDELERVGGAGLSPDAPELSAIRLSLVPTARALGVYQP